MGLPNGRYYTGDDLPPCPVCGASGGGCTPDLDMSVHLVTSAPGRMTTVLEDVWVHVPVARTFRGTTTLAFAAGQRVSLARVQASIEAGLQVRHRPDPDPNALVPDLPEERPSVVRTQPPVSEPAPPVSEPVSEPVPPVSEPVPPVSEPVPPVSEPVPPVSEPPAPAPEPEPPASKAPRTMAASRANKR